MRILMITPLYPPAVGGAASYFREIVPRLAAEDEIEHLVVLTERMPGERRIATKGKLRVLRYLPLRLSVPRKTWLGHAISYVLTQLWFATVLPALVSRNRIDLVHWHTRYRGRPFYRTMASLNVPNLADLRDRMSDPGTLDRIASLILTCAQGVDQFVMDGGVPAERTELVPNVFLPPEPPSAAVVAGCKLRHGIGPEDYVLYVGDMNASKGVYELIDAIDTMNEAGSPTRLLLAGTNRDGAQFTAAVEASPSSRYLGRVPHADALALMRGAKALLLPSRSEGMPTVLLEALAMGTPIVCPPDVPEFSAVMPDHVLPEITPEAIRQTLLRVLEQQQPPYPFADHAPQRVIVALMDIYRHLINDDKEA